MKNSKLQFKTYLLPALVITVSFLIVAPVFAAETFFWTKTQEIKVNQSFEVGVFINTDNEEINAIEGKVIFPQDLLEIKKINDGNSIINFWIEKPKSATEGQIAFSGIVPGGYNDSKGLILSIVFLAKKEGSGAIEFSGVKALRNDGKGTEATLTISNFQFLISKQASASQIPTPKTEDLNPPEEFTPQIAADPAIFEGKWFIVFATQDKGSGIDHYEVCEGKRKCVTAESPYFLQNQDLDEEIVVKAIDKSGNERVATIPAQKPHAWYKDYAILAILIIVIAAVAYLIWKILWKKRRK
ncbi:MAG: cohesin domain-containing protein [Candidatus Azambacteria bacterium]|nr:cohesin domain-containing protein [Candidatus Azambacteria bacterium]